MPLFQCSRCKRQPFGPAILRHIPPSRSRTLQFVCSRCKAEPGRNTERTDRLVLAGLLAAGVALAAGIYLSGLGWTVLNLTLLAIFVRLLIVPHELGHAVGAWITGMKVLRIYVGHGVSIFNGKHWGFFRDYRPGVFPGGFTFIAQYQGIFPRLRRLILTVCGPLANVLLWVVVLNLAVPGHFFIDVRGWNERALPAHVFILANALMLLFALGPNYHNIDGEMMPSDGQQILLLPFTFSAQIREWNDWALLQEAAASPQNQRLQQARRLYSHLHNHNSNLRAVRTTAVWLLYCGDPGRARELYRELLARPDLKTATRMEVQDGLATSNLLLMLGGTRTVQDGDTRTELAEEANALITEAMHHAQKDHGQVLSVLGTKGGILIELGQLEEGRALLREVILETEAPHIKAIGLCYLAIAAARTGDLTSCRTHLAAARLAYPESMFLPGSYLAAGLLFAQPDAGSRQQCLDLLERPDLSTEIRCRVLASVALIDLLLILQRHTPNHSRSTEPLATGELLAEAGRFASDAVAMAEPGWTVRDDCLAVQGAVFVESGRLEEGEAILIGVLGGIKDPGLSSDCLCYLALAAARNGKEMEGRGLLKQAMFEPGGGSAAELMTARLWPNSSGEIDSGR